MGNELQLKKLASEIIQSKHIFEEDLDLFLSFLNIPFMKIFIKFKSVWCLFN